MLPVDAIIRILSFFSCGDHVIMFPLDRVKCSHLEEPMASGLGPALSGGFLIAQEGYTSCKKLEI